MFAEYQEMRHTAEAPKTIKLYYFDSPGRAETIRATLAVGGVAYEDIRLSREDWQSFKPETPFGEMPVLEVDGNMVAQSRACARFAAKIAGLSGKSMYEEALADSVVDAIVEISDKFLTIHFEKDVEKKKAGMTEFTTDFLPGKLEILQKFISDHNGGEDGFFCGGELTWADLFFVINMDMLAQMIPTDWEAGRPKLKTLIERVRNDPRVKAYKDKKSE